MRGYGIGAFNATINAGEFTSFPSRYHFNRTVAYVLADTNRYVLDATGKFNVYNETPEELLNGMGFYMDEANDKYDLTFIEQTEPAKQMVSVNGEISANGKLKGNAHINSYSYHRRAALKRYKTDGEKKFIEYLQDKDNSMHIAALKVENMDDDSAPLMQSVDFEQDLAGGDDGYIYFNPNLFTAFRKNIFLSENRATDIDFGHPNSYLLTGTYKTPAGYKVDALPKSASMVMPDGSITFKRIVNEEDGVIALRYIIIYKKSIYFKESYPEFHDFFKKMYEMLNEQIVLKKA